MALPLNVNAVLRAITNAPLMRDKSVVRLSVTPSTKYSCSGSLPTDARAFVSKLEEGKYSPQSVRKRSGILRALTGWALVELELSGANPFKRLGIVKPIGQRDAGESFTYAEVRKLLSEAHRLNDDLRDIIRLLACTGARLLRSAAWKFRTLIPKK
jgi:integrase